MAGKQEDPERGGEEDGDGDGESSGRSRGAAEGYCVPDGEGCSFPLLPWRVWEPSFSSTIFPPWLMTCKESKRQTMNADDVLKAVEEIEFPEFVGPLKASLNEMNSKGMGLWSKVAWLLVCGFVGNDMWVGAAKPCFTLQLHGIYRSGVIN